MNFVTVAGVDLEVISFERLQDETGGAGAQRVLSGALRGRPLWSARAWSLEAYAESDAAADAVRGAVSHSQNVAVSGDGIGAVAIDARVTITADQYTRVKGGGWVRTLSLQIRESV